MPKKPKKTGQKVDSYKHSASKRPKIPTDQSVPYMPDEEKASVDYAPPPREGRRDPVLCWERGIEVDTLEIQASPLYIHEKIHPANFVESLTISGGGGAGFPLG